MNFPIMQGSCSLSDFSQQIRLVHNHVLSCTFPPTGSRGRTTPDDDQRALLIIESVGVTDSIDILRLRRGLEGICL